MIEWQFILGSFELGGFLFLNIFYISQCMIYSLLLVFILPFWHCNPIHQGNFHLSFRKKQQWHSFILACLGQIIFQLRTSLLQGLLLILKWSYSFGVSVFIPLQWSACRREAYVSLEPGGFSVIWGRLISKSFQVNRAI